MNTGKLLFREYLSDPVGFARTIIVFSILVGLCLFFLSLPTMVTEIRVGPHDTAEYDLHVQGAIPAEQVERAEETGGEVLPVYQWSGDVVAGDKTTSDFESWIVGDMAAAAEMTELNHRYVTAGAYEEGHAVVSKDLADDLGVGVGDTVTYRPARLNGTVEYEVSGIVRPVSFGHRTVVLGDASGLISRISATTPPVPNLDNASTVYGAAYVDCGDSGCADARDVFDSNLTSVATEAERIEEQKQAAQQFTGSPVVRLAPIAGFILYGLIYLRRSLLRAGSNESTYGVLRSMGASRRTPIAHILLDNAVVLVATTAVGVALASQIYTHAMGIYVPTGPLLELGGMALAANAAVVGAVSAVIVRRYANRDIVEMLEVGA
jgi:predicted lysophospholipase L1 biosynthesis ABC-type transport system permease subunit